MRRSPFTALCSQLHVLASPPRADLHVHTTASDGEYTPSQVAALAREAGLKAVAVTDHDTLAGVPEAAEAARNFPEPAVEVVPGVEITTELDGRELHLLGYFVRPDHAELADALRRLCERRRDRFFDYVAKLNAAGHAIPADRAELIAARTPSLGRRHVAALLVACGHTGNTNGAFYRFLHPLQKSVVPKLLLPIGDAVRLVREAGGASSLAHPPALTDDQFAGLRAAGLDGIEADYPFGRSSPGGRLREVAGRLGFVRTGGSDCHGPTPAHRRVGSTAVPLDRLDELRRRCGPAVVPA
ncbi:MAG TPA: PHP domain-containing protein [Urbifossiella sp.]|nr:PHP domain-containing protein [Urbifossiella sp.]